MRILHVVPGLKEPANGIAVAAKLIAREQQADLVETREFVATSSSTSTSKLNLSSYDEIWVHSNWWGPTIRACRKVLKAGVPLVRMPHANLDPKRMRSKGWKKLTIWWLVERRLMNRAARVVVTCEAEREWCRRAGVKTPFEIVDLKRFFRLKSFNAEAQRRREEPLHVLYLGRRHPLKGVEYLEEAIKELNSALQLETSTSTRFALRIVSDHTGEELEKDWVWCDVMCLPTLSDNFGLVIAEALERGKRVITTDGAPAWEGYPGVAYLVGYRDGSDETRVRLLKEAISRVALYRRTCL